MLDGAADGTLSAFGVSTFVIGGSTYAIVAAFDDDGIQFDSCSWRP
eukprot:COSAG06_NODE_114_length_23375_cov_20.304219_10_plen_46_part_00